MAKKSSLFFCSDCGNETARWVGQCPACHEWNTLKEAPQKTSNHQSKKTHLYLNQASKQPILINQIKDKQEQRILTGMSEFDRVLGGGIVQGSVILLGGDPGVGKSTILAQIMTYLSQGHKVLYVSGEESQQQIAQRCKRLKLNTQKLWLYTETEISSIIATLNEQQPQIIVIDSIQTIYQEEIKSSTGSVTQVRECCSTIVNYSKQQQCATFIVGHVTKDGGIAGPRVLEHMVDTVLYFEGDSQSRYRILRAFKNRFGAVNEIAVFAMLKEGIKQVTNPSALFIANRQHNESGSIIVPIKEGTRALLLEIQALVDSVATGYGNRLSIGMDNNRLSLLIAILSRYTNINCADKDVFINIVGGIKVTETSIDLGVALAIISSIKDLPIANRIITFGEVGLNGEIRPVLDGETRLKEAQKQGFTQAIIPKANTPITKYKNFKISPVNTIREALNILWTSDN